MKFFIILLTLTSLNASAYTDQLLEIFYGKDSSSLQGSFFIDGKEVAKNENCFMGLHDYESNSSDYSIDVKGVSLRINKNEVAIDLYNFSSQNPNVKFLNLGTKKIYSTTYDAYGKCKVEEKIELNYNKNKLTSIKLGQQRFNCGDRRYKNFSKVAECKDK